MTRPGAKDRFNTNAPLYQHIKALSALRAANPALADGAQVHRYASSNAGIFAFSRIDKDKRVEYVVALNNATTAKSATFATYGHNQRFAPIYGADVLGPLGQGRPAHRDRAGPVGLGLEGHLARWTSRSRLPRSTSPRPAPVTSSAVAPRSVPAIPDNTFAQVSFLLPSGRHDRLDQARHRRQRALPRLPRRQRRDGLPQGHAAGVPRRRQGLGRPPLGLLVLRHRRRPQGQRWRWRWRRPGHPARRRQRPRRPQLRDGLPRRLVARLRPRPSSTLDPKDQIWKGTYTLPAAPYAYKAAVNKSWDENYGAGGGPGRRQHQLHRSGRTGDLLLRPRHALGHLGRAGADHHRARLLPVRAGLPGRLDPGLHAAVAAGP